MFRACQFSHKLVCFIFFLRVFFYTLALFFNPRLLCCPHAFVKLAGWCLCIVLHLQPYSPVASVLYFCRSFSMSSVTQDFFVDRCLPRMSLTVSVTAVLKLLIKVTISVTWLSKTRSATNFPLIFALKISAKFGSLSFSRLSSLSFPVSAPGKLLVLAMFTLDWKHRLAIM